jgi:hypothetical protein
VEGEVSGGEAVVGGEGAAGVGELVVQAVIGTGVEVAGGAGDLAIAAELHVPEEGFAEDEKGVAVTDVSGEIRGSGRRDRLERQDGLGGALRAEGEDEKGEEEHCPPKGGRSSMEGHTVAPKCISELVES